MSPKEKKHNLLKEVVVEADTLIQVATENAKLQLEEAFQPQLQSMLSSRIQNEIEGGEDEDEFGDITEPAEDESFDSGEESFDDEEGGGEESFDDGEESFDDEGGEESFDDTEDVNMDGEEDEFNFDDEDIESAPEENPEEPTEDSLDDTEEVPPTEDEEDSDIQEIINELEMDDEFDGEFGDDEYGDESEGVEELDNFVPESDEMSIPDESTNTDEIDIDEILREVEEEDSEIASSDEEQLANLKTENAMYLRTVKKLKKDLQEHVKALQYTKSKLNEVNLLNAKLLYTNKLFKKNNLTQNEKMKVIECFDRAKNLEQVKLLFSSLGVTYNAAKKVNVVETKKPLNKVTAKIAGGASKPMRSTKPTRPITEEVQTDESLEAMYDSLVIVENNESKERFQSLANIGKKKKK